RSTPMKFIAKLRVWGNWGIGENVLKVFLRFRGSANRRVDLFLPLIASISGRRRGAGGVGREAWGVGRENRCREDVGARPNCEPMLRLLRRVMMQGETTTDSSRPQARERAMAQSGAYTG